MVKLKINHQRIKLAFNGKPWILLLGLILFIFSLFVATFQPISSTEESVFRMFYDLPAVFKPFFLLVTLLGSVWGLLAAIVINYLYRRRKEIYQLVFGGALAYLLSGTFKYIVARPRPYLISETVFSKEVFTAFGHGFPSTHSAAAMAIAIIAWHELPKKWRPLPIVLAILVGISRVYLGVHMPLDVVGGWGIGLIAGSAITSLKQQKTS